MDSQYGSVVNFAHSAKISLIGLLVPFDFLTLLGVGLTDVFNQVTWLTVETAYVPAFKVGIKTCVRWSLIYCYLKLASFHPDQLSTMFITDFRLVVEYKPPSLRLVVPE